MKQLHEDVEYIRPQVSEKPDPFYSFSIVVLVIAFVYIFFGVVSLAIPSCESDTGFTGDRNNEP